jgi:hypothetical protein
MNGNEFISNQFSLPRIRRLLLGRVKVQVPRIEETHAITSLVYGYEAEPNPDLRYAERQKSSNRLINPTAVLTMFPELRFSLAPSVNRVDLRLHMGQTSLSIVLALYRHWRPFSSAFTQRTLLFADLSAQTGLQWRYL